MNITANQVEMELVSVCVFASQASAGEHRSFVATTSGPSKKKTCANPPIQTTNLAGDLTGTPPRNKKTRKKQQKPTPCEHRLFVATTLGPSQKHTSANPPIQHYEPGGKDLTGTPPGEKSKKKKKTEKNTIKSDLCHAKGTSPTSLALSRSLSRFRGARLPGSRWAG